LDKIIRLDSLCDLAKIEIENIGYYKSSNNNILQTFEDESFFEQSAFISKVNNYIDKKQTFSPILTNHKLSKIDDDSEFLIYPDNLNYFNMEIIGKRNYITSGIYNFWASDSFDKLKGQDIALYSYDGPFLTMIKIDIAEDGAPIQRKESVFEKNPIIDIYRELAGKINEDINGSNDRGIKQIVNYLVSVNVLSTKEFILPISNSDLTNYHKIQIDKYLSHKDLLQKIIEIINDKKRNSMGNTRHYFSYLNDNLIQDLEKATGAFSHCSIDSFIKNYNNYNKKIPLFYKYPLKIVFEYNDDNETKELIICERKEKYKLKFGQKEVFVADKSFSNPEKKKKFKIPVKIDGTHTKDYSCEIKDYNGNKDVKIEVKFEVELGKTKPSILLRDIENDERKITGEFVDKEPDKFKLTAPFPKEKLIEHRESEVQSTIKQFIEFKLSKNDLFVICSDLSKIINSELEYTDLENKKKLGNIRDKLFEYNKFRDVNNYYFTYFTLIDSKKVFDVQKTKLIKKPINDFFQKCHDALKRSISPKYKDKGNIREIFIRSGFLYGLNNIIYNFEDINEDSLIRSITSLLDIKVNIEELFRFLSRLTYHTNMFQFYTGKLYDEIMRGEKSLISDYLWGYSRTLLWYCPYTKDDGFHPKEHFIKIIELGGETDNYAMKQNIMLSLFFLLTYDNKELLEYIENERDEIKKAIKLHLKDVKYSKLKEISYTNTRGEEKKTEFLDAAFLEVLEGSKVDGSDLLTSII